MDFTEHERNLNCLIELNSVLLIGANDLLKSSIAFGAAYEMAAKGEIPLFICNRTKIELKPPLPLLIVSNQEDLLSISSPRFNPIILSNIHMKYITNISELKASICGLNLFSPTPTCVIIEDLSLIIDPLYSVPRDDNRFLDGCLLLGAMISEIISCMKNHSSGYDHSFKLLLITDECNNSQFLNVMQRVVDSIMEFTNNFDGPPSLSLIHNRNGNLDQALPITIFKDISIDEFTSKIICFAK
eukprot:gene6869-9406_t